MRFIASMFFLTVSTLTWAQGFEVDGIFYEGRLSDDGTYTSEAYVTKKGSGYYSGSLVIPSQVQTGGRKFNVIGIHSSAFRNCTSLTSVTIPSSVKQIDGYAFYGCSALTSVNIPSGVKSIGDYTFFRSGLTSVSMPSGITSIGEYAFGGCSMQSITIPSTVTTSAVMPSAVAVA